MAYFPGDTVRVTGTFRAVSNNALTDPTAVTVTVRSPSHTVTAVTATQDSTGIYHADVTVDQPGQWVAQVKGTGAVAKSTMTSWTVDEGA